MTLDLEDRIAASLHEWARGVPVGPADPASSIGLAVRRRAARRSVVAAAGLTVGVLAALVIMRPTSTTVQTADQPTATSPVSEAVAVADVPQIRLPGWRTTYFVALPGSVDGLSYVEYQFEAADGRHLQVSFYGTDVTQRTNGEQRTSVTVRGFEGSLLDYGDGRYRADWLEGGRVWEADGSPFDSVDAFAAVIAQLQHIDAATWAASLPEGTTMPADRPAAVATLLEGVPLPAGFDRAALEAGPAATPYYLATDVYGHVACAWVETWGEARASGDVAGADAAAAALATAVSWTGLWATAAEGAYADVLWEQAKRVIDGDPSVLDTYRSSLGC